MKFFMALTVFFISITFSMALIIFPRFNSLSPRCSNQENTHSVVLRMARGLGLRDTKESKRQGRMGQLLRSEISTAIRRGTIKSTNPLGDSLREKISIVDVQMSADMGTCKVFVSVFGDAVEKRQAFAWLVEHSKPVRYALAQSLRDMKVSSSFCFKKC